MNVIFMGTPDYAEKILERLVQTESINVVAVYTQPDKKVGRKKVLTSPVVKTLAEEKNIKVFQPNRLRDELVVEELLTIACDYIVVAAYGQILPRTILEHAPCINLHASILPHYRGASPIQQTLLNDDKKTGVTAMLMEEGLDTGEILKINTIDVPKEMMLETLFSSLTEIACELTVEVLQNFEKFTPHKQLESEASHCKKISKKDGLVAFVDAHELYSKYRAYTPWPGIYLETGMKLKKIDLIDKCALGKSGTILEINSDNILVSCDKGVIRIYSVQPQSKKEMNIIAYINGKRLGIDDSIS
jgi:methionyl-tRNA formyltransferase